MERRLLIDIVAKKWLSMHETNTHARWLFTCWETYKREPDDSVVKVMMNRAILDVVRLSGGVVVVHERATAEHEWLERGGA